MKIAIVGLGYVGLPLALQFARRGVGVVGIDIDPEKVACILAKKTYIKHVSEELLACQVMEGRFTATTDFGVIKTGGIDAIIICVPTPLNKNREPDISYVLNTGREIAKYLQKGQLVSLESSTYPGTSDEDLRKVLESGSGLKAGVDFHLAFSPEREDPGNRDNPVETIPKVVGGFSPVCRQKAEEMYGKVIQKLVPVSSCRAAEATKLLENIFRCVNIALVNELKMVFDVMGIDVWEVIQAASTKPFGFMPFYPGPGLGGHCIPIDPFYLTWKAREYGKPTKFIELAGEINTAMPEWVVGKVAEALNEQKKPINGSRILLLGLAYKANVDDDRESPSYVLMTQLQARGAIIEYYDPYCPKIKLTREHPQWAGKESIAWSRELVSSFDCVLIATKHDCVNYSELSEWARIIVDTRNAMKFFNDSQKIIKA